ncbi:uncharacterized protein LOC120417730 [Culex pipiens pallens]|uniref:uncharacterized protein LOC120417730 n=1 Tax=Culex pipiens pallens TaxID=42434 RepID=UPI001952E838|nr:uncharacterized protein LOC120417730 [Culex pipiens pallens]
MAKLFVAFFALLGISSLTQAAITSQEVNRVLVATGYPQIDATVSTIVTNGINGMTTDRNEAAMFLAQVIHESGGFKYREEIGGASRNYAPYYGRGYIQLTWDYNYRAASRDIFGDERLVRDPGMVSRDLNLSMRVSTWFWVKNVRPAGGVSQNNFGLTTKAINGALESGSNNPVAIRSQFGSSEPTTTTMVKLFFAISALLAVSCLSQVASAVTSQEVNQVLAATGYRQVDATLAGVIANGINGMTSDRNEVAMFLAQVIYESAGFHYREEIGGASKSYAPYYGRGYIQLTWKYNYQAASRDIFNDDRLVRDPGMVSRDTTMSMRASTWFWVKNVRPKGGVSKNNFGLTTRAIWGNPVGGSSNPVSIKRYDLYKKAAKVLGVTNVGINSF